MKIDPYCQRRNCSSSNALFSDVKITLISQGILLLYGVKQVRGGETRYFRAKCVNITRQMAVTAAALLQTSRYLVCNFFLRRIGAIFGMLSRRAGL